MSFAPSSRAEAVGRTIAQIGSLALLEVQDATPLAGALFRKHFNATIPAFPRHFVLVDRARDQGASAIGYVHHTRFGDASLAGGLVVSALEFRRLDEATASAVRGEGGLAEFVMRASCASAEGLAAVFAYMGDTKSIRVNLRVGFVPTEYRHLHVLWKTVLAEDRRKEIVARVGALGPF